VGIAYVISKPGFSQASSAGQHGWPIDFACGEHGPCNARQLIRQRHASDVLVGARRKLGQPRTQTGRLLRSKIAGQRVHLARAVFAR